MFESLVGRVTARCRIFLSALRMAPERASTAMISRKRAIAVSDLAFSYFCSWELCSTPNSGSEGPQTNVTSGNVKMWKLLCVESRAPQGTTREVLMNAQL